MRARTIRGLITLLLLVAGCGGDSIRHIADAPAAPGALDDAALDDAAIDAPIDAPASNDVQLQLTLAGTGSGTVTSSPAGISCGTDCTASFAKNTVVTLTATPVTGSVFAGWSGNCTGTLPTCDVMTMDMARTVTATFTLKLVTLTVNETGTGVGAVNGAGISCNPDCTETVNYGTTIVLAATPSSVDASASKFDGWSGACSGITGCSVTLVADTSVTAGFTLLPNYIFVTSTVQNGSLGGLAGADSICKARASAANLPGNYRAYLSSLDVNTPINAPSRVGTATGWIRTDGKPVMNKIAQFAAGTLFAPPSLTEDKQDVAQTQFLNAWTGTNSSGTFQSACGNSWISTSGEAHVGQATSMTSTAVIQTTSPCVAANRLYCLGVDRAAVAQ